MSGFALFVLVPGAIGLVMMLAAGDRRWLMRLGIVVALTPVALLVGLYGLALTGFGTLQ